MWVYLANMQVLKAREKLEEWNAGRLEMDPESLERVAMTATDDKELAHRYFVAAVRHEFEQRRAANHG